MDTHHLHVLQDLYQSTADRSYVSLDTLITTTGIEGVLLRSILEDLKEKSMIVEHEEGFQIAPPGINYAQSRWL